MTTRWKALGVMATVTMLVAACGGSSGGGGSTDAAKGKIKVTLITKATGGFWDAMIAGAKKYATDNPSQIELTTLACKTNDDTPCQIAQIQDTVTKGAKAIVISPMGPGVVPALQKAVQAGVKVVFVDNTVDGVDATAISATDNVKGGEAAGAYIKTQLKAGDTIGLLIAVKGVPNLDQRIDGVKAALAGTGVNVVIGGQQTTCDPKIGAAVTQDLLTKYPNLTAIYSACDSPAIGAATVAKQKNHPLEDLRLRRGPRDVQAHSGGRDDGHDGAVAVQDDQPRHSGGGQLDHGKAIHAED